MRGDMVKWLWGCANKILNKGKILFAHHGKDIKMHHMLPFHLLLGLGLLFLAGCDKVDPRYEAEDDRNPHFQKASRAQNDRDYVAAAKAYEEALQKNPGVADAHYELGLLYGEKLGEPVNAMYHFRKYLAMRPDSPKREMVQAHLDSAKINFATTMPNSPVQNAEAFVKLQSENLALRKELDEKIIKVNQLEAQLAKMASTAAAAPATAAPTAPLVDNNAAAVTPEPSTAAAPATPVVVPPSILATPATPPPSKEAPMMQTSMPQRTHTIQARDTLWKISKIYYPSDVMGGIQKIQKANADVLKEGKPLKIGTVIVIPE